MHNIKQGAIPSHVKQFLNNRTDRVSKAVAIKQGKFVCIFEPDDFGGYDNIDFDSWFDYLSSVVDMDDNNDNHRRQVSSN